MKGVLNTALRLMDVRCEKCLTTYELDDSKVGDAGLTVKCQECGNLFKVRRRPDTAELVAQSETTTDRNEVAAGEATSDTLRELDLPTARATPGDAGEDPSTETSVSSPGARRATRPGSSPPSEDRSWMVRSASTGEVARFRELTTLQQWIVERKVSRDDEISRGGESWKQLGGIAELASFFHVVEQAASVAHASMPGLAVQRSNDDAPRDLPNLPTAMLPKTGPRRSRPPESDDDRVGVGTIGDTIVDDGDERYRDPSRRSGSGAAFVIGGIVLVGAIIAGGVYLMRRPPPRDAGTTSAETAELARRGRAAFLSDTDDGFREAISLLDRALESDPGSPSALNVRVDLGEAHVTWAAYLLEDARRLETSSGAAGAGAARTLRAEAQGHLERARRVLEEPNGSDAAGAATEGTLARAFGDLLRVEGGPAAAAERYLQRAAQKGGDDPELAYALGELALREGKNPEALSHLQNAARAELVRANYRLAALARAAGRSDEAKRACDALLKASPKHDRGRGICGATEPTVAADLGAVAARVADAGIAPGSDPALAPPATGKPREAGLAPPGSKEALPSDYKSLVREADRLSENGRSQQARKVYERALEVDARGVAALTGLGYCDLDAERFMQAVDRFNAALAIDPSNGDAVVGLAESYKVRGQTLRAIEQYKKYLAAHPTGPKAAMAQKNLRDLEPKAAKEAETTDKLDLTKKPKDETKPKDEAKPKDETTLPRPPPEEPPL